MNEEGHYPPPDFSIPPPNSFQPFQQQQQPGAGSFHSGMWSWQETCSETSWGYGSYHVASACYGQNSIWGSYGQGQSYGHQWHQGGGRGGRPHGTHDNYGKKKNKKEPEYSFFCDTCDRGFKNAEKYHEHMSQHVKCSVPDCNFMAHEKIVSIHWKNTHAPGAKRIKLDTPEEIAKWREERRKNYPTRENVEKKRKMMEMREETGGVLETAQFGRMRGRGRGQRRGRGRGRGWGNGGFQGHQKRGHQIVDGNSAEKSPIPDKLNRDRDPLGALACSGDHDSDKEDAAAEPGTGNLIVAPKKMSSALGSLMANYGSMSESEEEQTPVPVQKAKELIQENKALLNTMLAKSQESAAESMNIERHGYRRGSRGKRGRGGRGGKGRHQDTPLIQRPTLLEMLLAPDIRHERNILLQCVRYVVRKKFFGLESKPQEKSKGSIIVTNPRHSAEEGEAFTFLNPLDDVKKDSLRDSTESKEKNIDVSFASGCGQVLNSDQCVSQNGKTLDCSHDLKSEQDGSEQSLCLSVEALEKCAVQSFPEVSQNIHTPSTTDCQDTNKSSYHIYNDEIWE